MSVNITSVSGVISISQNGGTSKSYFGQSGRFTCMADNTTFQILIGGDPYTVQFDNLTVNGQAPSTLSEAFTLLGSVFQQANSSSGGSGSSYLVYTASLLQEGTSAPVATVHQNTLGGAVIWSYSDVGQFIANLDGAFTADKTCLFLSSIGGGSGYAQRQDSDNIALNIFDNAGAGANDYLSGTGFEIRVYP